MSQSNAPGDSAQELIRRARGEEASDGEALNTETRSVLAMHSSLYVNLTDYGKRTLDICEGDPVKVHTFRDGIVILQEGDDGL